MEENINQIEREGDLSPRSIRKLKSSVKKKKQVIPLQVQIRSSKDKDSNSD